MIIFITPLSKCMHSTQYKTISCYEKLLIKVQQQWVRYTEKMDKMVEEAFRLNIKWSLQELSKAINGDGKSAPNPLFRVKVCLQGDKVGWYKYKSDKN